MAHLFNGISSNQILHVGQAYNTDSLRLFDFGPTINGKLYNVKFPEKPNFSIITAPKLFIYGSDDNVITKESVLKSLPLVTNVTEVVEVKGFNHLHFIFSDDIKRKVYDIVSNHIRV